MSGVGRYWRLALDLMPRPDLAVHPTLGKPNVLRMDDFPANDTASVMQAARRASSLLGLPDPILAEGLIDGASRELSASDGAGWRLYLRGRWMGASNFFEVAHPDRRRLSGLVTTQSLVTPRAQLDLRCASSWHVRNEPISFNFVCPDDFKSVDVPAGPTVLGVWDLARACWIERQFVVGKNVRAVLHVDEIVKAGRCSAVSWPPPS